jgi:hypothetical protein
MPDVSQRPQSARVQRSQQANSHLTFKPEINPTSISILERKADSKKDLVSRLYGKQKEYDFKVWVKQQEKENQEISSCTFHPNRGVQRPNTSMISSIPEESTESDKL